MISFLLFFYLLLNGALFFGQEITTKITLNTSQSGYSSLQGGTCIYDSITGSVTCVGQNGLSTSFTNIQKQYTNTKPTNGTLIGTYVDTTNAKNTVYVFALAPGSFIGQSKASQIIARAAAEKIFNPVKSGNPPTPNPYPTTSLNESGIDALYGSGGLKVDALLLTYIKNCYFYLEYLVKLEYAARLINYAESIKLDVLSIYDKDNWTGLLQTCQQKAGGWSNLQKLLFAETNKPAWNDLRGLIKASSWQELIKTPFWTAFSSLKPADFLSTDAWQSYLQYTISRGFVQDENILLMLKELKESLFKYIPNIEVAYYHPDFTNLRQGYELFLLHMLVNENKRNRLLPQASQWGIIKNKDGSFDLLSIYKDAQA